MKLWGGRFETGPSEIFERYSGSLHFDKRLADCDIRGSQAFARALQRGGVGVVQGELRSARGGPAVDAQHGSGDEARLVARQPHDRGRYLVGPARASDRVGRHRGGVRLRDRVDPLL